VLELIGRGASGTLAAQIEPFLFVEAIDSFVIDLPTLASHQNIDAPKAETNPDAGDFTGAGFKRRIQPLDLGLGILACATLLAD